MKAECEAGQSIFSRGYCGYVRYPADAKPDDQEFWLGKARKLRRTAKADATRFCKQNGLVPVWEDDK